MPELKKTDIQPIQITFSNGKTGVFIGKAVVSEEEMETVTIENIALGEPEPFDENIKQRLIDQTQ